MMMAVVLCFFMVSFGFSREVESTGYFSLITFHFSSKAALAEDAESDAALVLLLA